MTERASQRVLFLCSGNYYRSRFAEHLFNHLAEAAGLPYRADSAGLWPECHTRNPGPMSRESIAALQARGVALPEALRSPRDVQASDIAEAALTIAVKEAEHRSIVVERFPELLHRVEFWKIDDVDCAPPNVALPLLEAHVLELVARLSPASK
jgi:protein-tyrosine phosphatase